MNTNNQNNKKAWVVAADMGYGHQRTAYPFRDIAFGSKIINANNYDGIPDKDKKVWRFGSEKWATYYARSEIRNSLNYKIVQLY